MKKLNDALITIPFAGAGASVFGGWRQMIPSGIDFLALQLPGREKRFSEQLLTSTDDAISDYWKICSDFIRSRDKVTVFGHSLGAILAYELAYVMEASDPDLNLTIYVSGSGSPTKPRTGHATDLTDSDFITEVENLAGYKHPALADPMMRELLLPSLRADVQMHETYVYQKKPKLRSNIICLRGVDDHLISSTDVEEWREMTTGLVKFIDVLGGHMYLVDNPSSALQFILHDHGCSVDDIHQTRICTHGN